MLKSMIFAIILAGPVCFSGQAWGEEPTLPIAKPAKDALVVDDKADLPTKPSILEVLAITGEILGGDAVQVAEHVKKINENPRIKAVFLELDTPGGGVAASQHIYEELSKIRVPVLAWCDGECASGGMYVAMAPSVKYIAIREGAISGSIGVLAHLNRYNRLLDWARIDAETFKSGLLKDAAASSHAETAEEKAYLQSIIDRLAGRFYSLVEKARGDKIKDWDRIKRAEIFFGQEGVEVGLVDEIMSRDQAIKKAKALSGASPIYTREEMKDMAKAAGGTDSEAAPAIPLQLGPADLIKKYLNEFDDFVQGKSITIEYREPIRF